MSALMISKKSPNVMRVKGMVRTITTGLITALAKPSSNADRKSDFLLVNEIPWKTRLTTHRDKAVIPQLTKNSSMSSPTKWRQGSPLLGCPCSTSKSEGLIAEKGAWKSVDTILSASARVKTG
jgi:hypothetical protein